MKHLFRKAWALALAGASIFCLCTGCHGTAERTTFALPDAFDTSKSYEVTFWAKTIPTRLRPIFTKRPLPILKRCIPTLQ